MFAAWQRTEHIHQCELIHDSLSSQADAFSSAVASGVQSHRWFSAVRPATITINTGSACRVEERHRDCSRGQGWLQRCLFSGDRGQVDFALPVGEHPRRGVLQVVRGFTMRNNPPMHGEATEFSDAPASVDFHSVVVLDRTRMMAQVDREARNRILIFVLGTLLLIAAGAVWQFTVRLAQAEGTTRVLQAETRHLRELGQAAAGLAHETRNPLGLIRGWTQRLVKAGLPTDDQQEQAEAVLEECDRVTARSTSSSRLHVKQTQTLGRWLLRSLSKNCKRCCSQTWMLAG